MSRQSNQKRITGVKNKKQLYIDWEMSGAAVEEESFRRIEKEVGPHSFTEAQWRIVRRLIHATADASLQHHLVFRNDPIQAGLDAVRDGAPIYCDSSMSTSGISLAALKRHNSSYTRESIHCFVAAPRVAQTARERGVTRSLIALQAARDIVDGGIVLIGNAPLALAGLARMIKEDNVKPRLVIGMPVGFVHVLESKEMIQQTDVPQIVLNGRRGGSPMVVAALHGIIK